MSLVPPLVRIPVGIVAERRRAKSQWIDFIWRPVSALAGVPDTAPWTRLSGDDELAMYYVGGAEVELFPSETSNYRDNLVSGKPQLWVVLRPTDADPPYNLVLVTADPAEGEGYTQNGTDLVDPVPMPESFDRHDRRLHSGASRRAGVLQAQARPRGPRSLGAAQSRAQGPEQMSEDKNFLSRWSRKKRAAVEPPPQAAAPAAEDAKPKESTAAAAAAPAGGAKGARTEADQPKFDLASLPSLELIGADTDIRPFLLPGVPAELTRAALRRVWMADPAIRDFIGLSENSWDFTKPGGVPGFDLSDPGIDVKRLAEELFGAGRKSGEEKSPETASPSIADGPQAPGKAPERPAPVARAKDHDRLKLPTDSVSENAERVPEQGLLAAREDMDTAVQHEPRDGSCLESSPKTPWRSVAELNSLHE